MNKIIPSTELHIKAILIAVFSIVYFYSFINYSTLISVLLIAIAMALMIPFLYRESTVNITFCRLIWAVAICVALIEMRRCSLNGLYGDLYFLLILLLIILYKEKYNSSFYFSERLIFIMGVVFAAFTIFEALFTDYFSSMFLPLMRINGSWDILSNIQQGRHSGLTNQASINAVYLAFGIGACFISYLFAERRKDKIKLIILVLVEAICILLTSKRGPFIYTLLSILLIYYYNSSRGRKITTVVKIVFFLVTVVFIMYYVLPSANMFITNYMEGTSKLGDISNGRYALYKAAWQYFLDNKLFGIGWTNFRYSYFRYIDVHNIYLQLLCETGVIGAIPFFLAFIYTYISSIKKMNRLKERDDPSYRSILFSLYLQTFFLLHGMTSNALYDYFISFFYFIGVIISDNTCVDT